MVLQPQKAGGDASEIPGYEEVYEVVKLHDHQGTQLVDEACDLLNCEWPRSKTARLHSLQQSCDAFPVHLVLVRTVSEGPGMQLPAGLRKEVLGHVRVQMQSAGRFLMESLLVKESERGKGLGAKLVKHVEDLVRKLNCHWTDRELRLTCLPRVREFYERLGYQFIHMEKSKVFDKDHCLMTKKL